MHSAFIVGSISTQTVEQENGAKCLGLWIGCGWSVEKIWSMNYSLFAKINCLTHECP